MLRDATLPHQITLTFRQTKWPVRGSTLIAVGCNCGAELGAQPRWDDPSEPARLWRAHMMEA